jgi:indole-3-glycerol phosphate synthase
MTLAAQSDFLLGMAAASRQRDQRARATLSDARQRSLLLSIDAPRPLQLLDGGFDVIAEIKKRSPAEGELAQRLVSPAEQAGAYVGGGAVALSVLTEPEQFKGSLDDLHDVVAVAADVPVMRKDFLVSRYQVREARLAGASGVLLIAAMLDAGQLESMLEASLELNMYALVEIFDEADMESCMSVLEKLGPARDGTRCNFLLGVNCRDLHTLQVNFGHFAAMAPYMPADVPLVAESGLTDFAQATVLAELGYSLALVGTTLMRSDDPSSAVSAIRAAGNAGVATCS